MQANATKQLEYSFATALVLTDGDSLALGYGNFDPKKLISPHHANAIDANAVDLRQQLSLFSVPFDWHVSRKVLGFDVNVHSQVSYLKQSQTINVFENAAADSSEETMHSAMLGMSFEKPIGSKWFYKGQLNTHLMHYKNDYAYVSKQSQIALKPLVEGLYTNIQSNALILNPSASLMYRLPRPWGYYEYKLEASYYYGFALSQPEKLNSVNPESLQINNGIKAKFNMFDFYKFQQALYVKAQRVDLHADSQQTSWH